MKKKISYNKLDGLDYYDPSVIDQFSIERAKNLFQVIVTDIHPHKDAKILDIGFGGGWLLGMLSKSGFDTYGCDVSDGCISETRSKGINNLVKVNIEEGLPYKGDVFDLVVCSEVIEHLFDPHTLLQEINRVLKTKGFAVFSFLLELNIMQRLRIISGKNIHDPLAIGSHIRFFKPCDVNEILAKNRFRIIDKRYYCFGSKLDTFTPKIGFVLSNYLPDLFAGNVILKAQKLLR